MIKKTQKSVISLVEALDFTAQNYPEKSILLLDRHGKQEKRNYRELAQASKRAASGWEKWVQKGDRILFPLPTGFDFLVGFFGALRIGAVPIPVAPPSEHQDASDRAEFIARLAERMQAKAALFELDEPDVERPPELGTLERVLDLSALMKGKETYTPNLNAIAYIQMTSGTTGTRRGACLTHSAIIQNIEATSRQLDVSEGDILCSWLPLYNMLGLLGAAIFSIYHGLEAILIAPERFVDTPETWLETMSQHRVSLTLAPSHAFYYAARRTPKHIAEKLDLSALRFAIVGGDMIRKKHLESFADLLQKSKFDPDIFTAVYGLSEATFTVSLAKHCLQTALVISREELELHRKVVPMAPPSVPSYKQFEFIASGTPIDETHFRITNSKGMKLPPLTLGSIVVKSDMLMERYFSNETELPQKSGKWLITDDLGFIFEDSLYFVARANEALIMPDGRLLFAHELEFVLDAIDGIRLGCTMVFTPEFSDYHLIVAAEIEPGADREEIETAIGEQLFREYRIRPQKIQLLSPHSIPRSPNGKVRRHLVREFYNKRSLERRNREQEFEGIRRLAQRTKHVLWKWLRKRADEE